MKGHLGVGLTDKIYLGTHDGEKWKGKKTDITSEFIEVMLQRFPPGQSYDITVDGVVKYEITVKGVE
jgi:hypothetical protein